MVGLCLLGFRSGGVRMHIKDYFTQNTSIQNKNEYDADIAKHLCYMCELVYMTDNQGLVMGILENYKKQDLKFFDMDGTEALMVKCNGYIIIAFRGTEETKDILTDLNLIPVGGEKQGLVHMGFKHGLNKIWNSVEQTLDLWYTEGDTIYLTGHSLGGALATVAAARSKYICQVYTFGQPRVGNRKYCKTVKSKFYRHVCGADIVPSVPFGLLYSHMGELYHIDNDEKKCYKVTSRFSFFKKRWKARFRSLFSRKPLLKLVDDHRLPEYRKYI